jgi:ketosteroid isomerase-like protein
VSNVARDRVGDELALRNLVARYADAVTRMEADALRELFTPDGHWIVTGHGEPRGHDEIVAFLEGLLANWNGIVHALLSGTVTLDTTDPFRATGRWYISEFGQMKSGDEVFFAGVYHDEYQRDAGVWRFARRRYDSLFRRAGGSVATSPFPEA